MSRSRKSWLYSKPAYGIWIKDMYVRGISDLCLFCSTSNPGRCLLKILPLLEDFIGSLGTNPILLLGNSFLQLHWLGQMDFHFCWSLPSVAVPLETRSLLLAFLCWRYSSSRKMFLDKIWPLTTDPPPHAGSHSLMALTGKTCPSLPQQTLVIQGDPQAAFSFPASMP